MSDAAGPSYPSFQLCHCTGVRRAKVLAAIAAGARSVDELRRATGVCTGCSTCYPEVRQLLTDVAAGLVDPAAVSPAADSLPPSPP